MTTGDQLSREEFLRIWDNLPDLKNAELIDGVVYVASPVSRSHWSFDTRMIWWLAHYAFATPGCEAGNNGTWLMSESAPQPDAFLRILPAHGGQSRDEGEYPCGAPELVVEICITSTEIDFGRKLALYQRAGVREYLTIEELPQPRLIWRVLDAGGSYRPLSPGGDGVYRSRVFPGLWLNPQTLWSGDGEGLRRVLDAGLASPEHAAFLPTLI